MRQRESAESQVRQMKKKLSFLQNQVFELNKSIPITAASGCENDNDSLCSIEITHAEMIPNSVNSNKAHEQERDSVSVDKAQLTSSAASCGSLEKKSMSNTQSKHRKTFSLANTTSLGILEPCCNIKTVQQSQQASEQTENRKDTHVSAHDEQKFENDTLGLLSRKTESVENRKSIKSEPHSRPPLPNRIRSDGSDKACAFGELDQIARSLACEESRYRDSEHSDTSDRENIQEPVGMKLYPSSYDYNSNSSLCKEAQQLRDLRLRKQANTAIQSDEMVHTGEAAFLISPTGLSIQHVEPILFQASLEHSGEARTSDVLAQKDFNIQQQSQQAYALGVENLPRSLHNPSLTNNLTFVATNSSAVFERGYLLHQAENPYVTDEISRNKLREAAISQFDPMAAPYLSESRAPQQLFLTHNSTPQTAMMHLEDVMNPDRLFFMSGSVDISQMHMCQNPTTELNSSIKPFLEENQDENFKYQALDQRPVQEPYDAILVTVKDPFDELALLRSSKKTSHEDSGF